MPRVPRAPTSKFAYMYVIIYTPYVWLMAVYDIQSRLYIYIHESYFLEAILSGLFWCTY